jgi:hypothetical protein
MSCSNKSKRIDISQFEIKDSNGVTGIMLSKNGEILINSKIYGKVKENGEVFDNKNNIIAKLNANGILTDSKDQPLIKISENGVMDNGSGVLIKWAENGELLKGDIKTGMKISPNDSNLYRTASIILYLFLSFGK